VELAGKYRLICEIGHGGMAVVYLAVALGVSNFRKLAVVKVIRPQVAEEPGILEMFFDEARLSARLNHPNIVQTYDVGASEGQHFMAMEYLEGASLSAVLGHVQPAFPLLAKVMLEVLEGLKYAHALRDFDGTPLHIVHRDISPQNVFVTYTGQVKVLDFGIAKASTSSVRTATGVIKGKLKFMAPEQAGGRDVDGRADLFAVGVMLWEAMTGRRRFPPDTTDVTVYSSVALGTMPETPDATTLGYPAELNDILKRALAPEPVDRYQTAGAFHADLDAAIQKLQPCSLKDLGADAAETFWEEREKVNAVVEKRLRVIASADAAVTDVDQKPPPSSNALPTVLPPHGTGSTARKAEAELLALGAAQGSTTTRDARRRSPPDDGSTQHGLVARDLASLRPIPSSRSRLAIGIGVLGVVLAFVGVWRVRTTPHPGGGESTSSVPASVAEPPSAEVSPTLLAPPPATSPLDVPVAAPSGSERAGGPPSHVATTRPHKGLVAAPPITPEAPASPSASASAPPAVPKPDVERAIAPRSSTPKVQLERDNPWH
jgi:serine/threonine protein kinase